MSVATTPTASRQLLVELRSLQTRLPVPQPHWHPHVARIAACRDDFAQAIEELDGDPEALDLLAALVDGASEPDFAADASEPLAAAWQRLESLPLPEGQHPFLHEIVPALDALRLVLVTLSRTAR